MVGLIKGKQRIGKTSWLIAIVLWLCWYGGYKPSEIVANLHLYNEDGSPLQGYHYLPNKDMKIFIAQMIPRKIEHIIVLIDEIDRVFSHRTWHNTEQLETLIGLWQDEKCFYNVWGTAHLGLSVDSLIREISQVEIIVKEKDFTNNRLSGVVINSLNKEVFNQSMNELALIQKLFRTRERIV
jgi:hypothetical protein